MATEPPPNCEHVRTQRSGFVFSARPFLYVLLLLCAVVGSFGYKLRSDGIFACGADRYLVDHYLAYCNAAAYGDYDRGAFWFGLEPKAQSNAVEADVLFLGSSRMQFAFSTAATVDWFSSRAVRYYLLGFSHTENMVFMAPLLSKLKPRAKVYVINVDRFFDDRVTPPTNDILRDTQVLPRYTEKRFWQVLHKPICSVLPMICGSHASFFRHRENGAWQLSGTDAFEPRSVADGPSSNQERWPQYASLAEKFVSQLPVERHCVVLTIAPSAETKRAEAAAIATHLNLELVSSDIGGLRTFDGSHLDQLSAERWSSAFFQAVGPQIQRCLQTRQRPS